MRWREKERVVVQEILASINEINIATKLEGRLYLKVPPVYLIDDVQMTGQQAFEEVNGPALQCLRQDSVIGVRTGPHHNVPGLEIKVEGPVTPGETAGVRSRASRQR